MILDNMFNFAVSQSLTGTSDTNSTNIYEATSAVKLFDTGGRTMKIPVYFSAITGTNPTVRARLVGADTADLATNPVILADTGTSRAIVAGDNGIWIKELEPVLQADAKQYYGVIFTLGGTSPTATVTTQGALNSQTAGAPNLRNIA